MRSCLAASAHDLIQHCSSAGEQEVEKFNEDFTDLRDEILDVTTEKEVELGRALERAENFYGFLQVCNEFSVILILIVPN